MTYLYRCPTCNKQSEIIKPMMEASREEKCNTCRGVMNRVYTAVGIKSGDGVKV